MISFVIRTNNEEKKLEEVILAILKQTGNTEREIIIVDSGSTDRTLDIAVRYQCHIINVQLQDFSWGHDLNVGIEAAAGEIVALISGHCVLLDEDCVRNVEKIFHDHSDIAVVYGRQCGDIEVDPFEAINLMEQYPAAAGVHILQEEKRYSRVISSACTFLRKKIWEIQKFDEELQSCEDAKWADELQKQGFLLAYCGEIGVYHSHPLKTEYLYTKSFWREVEMLKIRREVHRKRYYYLKYVGKHFLYDSIQYRHKFKMQKIQVGFGKILAYSIVINTACLNASLYYQMKNPGDANVCIPKLIYMAGKKL